MELTKISGAKCFQLKKKRAFSVLLVAKRPSKLNFCERIFDRLAKKKKKKKKSWHLFSIFLNFRLLFWEICGEGEVKVSRQDP